MHHHCLAKKVIFKRCYVEYKQDFELLVAILPFFLSLWTQVTQAGLKLTVVAEKTVYK